LATVKLPDAGLVSSAMLCTRSCCLLLVPATRLAPEPELALARADGLISAWTGWI
jgi:hypothetical protein